MSTDDPTADDAPDRSCANCGAGMASHQDWCLECGTAAPGRLGGLRPGWRAVATTLALTLVLVGGAGAASYAALSSDANRKSLTALSADATPVALAPPPVAAPPAPVIPAPTPSVPKVKTPPVDPPSTPAEAPAAPAAPVTPVTPAPTATTPPSSSGGSSPAKQPDAADGKDGGTRTTADEKPRPVNLGADSVAVFDPYGRALDPGDPADAYDGDEDTALEFGGPEDGKPLQVGVVVDLESAQQVRGVELRTSTPGTRLEVYTTDSAKLPPDVLDARWDHPASRREVDSGKGGDDEAGDGIERILLPAGGAKSRYVLLWFTRAPKAGGRVGVSELDVLK